MKWQLGWMVWVGALILCVISPASLVAQTECSSGAAPVDRLTHGRYPSPQRTPEELVDEIRAAVYRKVDTSTACLWQLRPLLFDSAYTPHLVDWIVYVRGNRIIEGITQRNGPVRDRTLRGEKFINVIILFDSVHMVKEAETVVHLTTTDTLGVLLARSDSAVKMRLVVTEAVRALLLSDSTDGTGTSKPKDWAVSDSSRRKAAVGRDTSKASDRVAADSSKGKAQAVTLLKRKPVGQETAPEVEVRRDVLRLRRDPFLVQLVSGLGGKIFGGSPSLPETPDSRDSVYRFKLDTLGAGKDSTLGALLIAHGKIPLDDGMWGRLILKLPEDTTRPKMTRVLTNFVNTDRSRFGLSVGVGALPLGPRTVSKELVSVRSRPVDTLPGDTMPPIAPDTIKYRPDTTFRYSRTPRVIEGDTYVLVHYRFIRRNPWPLRRGLPLIPKSWVWYESAGVFVGTNLLKQSIGSRIPFGVSLDRLWYSDLGIAGGLVVARDEKYVGRNRAPDTKRRLLPFIGITLAL